MTTLGSFEELGKIDFKNRKFFDKNKEDVLKTLNLSTKKTSKIKKDTAKGVLAATKDLHESKIKSYLNRINDLLKKAFDESTKKDYTDGYRRLPDYEKTLLDSGIYKVLVSSLKKDGIIITLAKHKSNSIKLFISEDNLLEKSGYLRGDEIYVDLEKNGNDVSLKQIDDRLVMLKKRNLLDVDVFYMSEHAKTPFKGKIIGVGKDSDKKEVIFKPEKGVQFSMGIDTFFKGNKKALTFRKNQNNNPKKNNIKTNNKIEKSSNYKKSNKNNTRKKHNVYA